MVESDSMLEYVRGLLEGSELTEDERRDKALAALVSHLSRQTETVAELAAAVEVLRGEVAELRTGRAVSAAPAAPDGVTVYCAVCGAAIPLLAPWDPSGPNEVVCHRCGAEMTLE